MLPPDRSGGRSAHRADIEFAFTPRAFKHEHRRIKGDLRHPLEKFELKEFDEVDLSELLGR